MPTTLALKEKLGLFFRPIANTCRSNPDSENRATTVAAGVEAIDQLSPPSRTSAVLLMCHSRHPIALNHLCFWVTVFRQRLPQLPRRSSDSKLM
jgi:hypothetical protein